MRPIPELIVEPSLDPISSQLINAILQLKEEKGVAFAKQMVTDVTGYERLRDVPLNKRAALLARVKAELK